MATSSLALILVSVFFIHDVGAINCKGCTPLDSLTFDKMINNFRVSLIKFDVAYPYGEKHDEFAKVAVDGARIQELFIGEVGIKDYGDKDNDDLKQRFKLEKEDFPVVMLFVKDKSGKIEEHTFTNDEFISENIISFLRQHSGIYLALSGCLEQFDNLAGKLIKADKSAWSAILKETETAAQNLQDSKEQKRADIYIKLMKKVISDGLDFIPKETARTKKLLEGKITDLKKTDLQQKLNVLRAFTDQEEAKASKSDKKEEL